MGKAWHKPKPSPPKYYWWDTDGCWWCDKRRGCTGCKNLKEYVADQKERQRRRDKAKLDKEFRGYE